jgi:shikimate dehydrogenase
MKKACVIGWPVEHSRSPMIHGHWLQQYGIEGSYTKEAVKPEDLEEFLRGLPSRGFAGCNVTVPHKEKAYLLADAHHASANAVRAANTLWHDQGKLIAANTDTYGYMTYLTKRYPDWQDGTAPVSVLGAGGAARAIVYGFLSAGVSEVRLFNRSAQRALEMAQLFGTRVKAFEWQTRSTAASTSSVVVNTTTLGMNGDGDPGLDVAQLKDTCIVSDIVYVPLETALLAGARKRGLRTLDGLGMLLHQAVPGFEQWFGVTPEVSDELYRKIALEIEAY